MLIDERKSTQKFALMNILVKYCGQTLTPENILKILDELIYEVREGSCSWAFVPKNDEFDQFFKQSNRKEVIKMSMDEVERSMERPEDILGPGPIIAKVVEAKFEQSIPEDPWIHRAKGMLCKTCMYYVAKLSTPPKLGPITGIGRCRRHAPTMSGYPVVFPTDWCGDHKLDENCG